MAKSTVFDFKNYKSYLNSVLEQRGSLEKGQRLKLAQNIGCNPSYLSQVLNGMLNLSPEQAQNTNAYLGHTSNESRYFLNLVLLARAGTKSLKNHYEDELKKMLEDHLIVRNRVKINRELNEMDQARYYSTWYYAAIHMCVSLPHMRTREQLATGLQLPLQTVNEVLEFLVSIGVLRAKGKEFEQGETNLYITSTSPFISKHHSNWRIKGIQSLDKIKEKDLHYSGVITCSEEDVLKIKDIMIQAIEKIRETVKQSKDETSYVYTLDLFGLL
jgi:uncharacterized protein (TIGR02147 family)